MHHVESFRAQFARHRLPAAQKHLINRDVVETSPFQPKTALREKDAV
jgi:hypothetical protein